MPPRTGLLMDFTTYFQPLGTLPDTPTGESVAFTAGELAAFTEVGPKFICSRPTESRTSVTTGRSRPAATGASPK